MDKLELDRAQELLTTTTSTTYYCNGEASLYLATAAVHTYSIAATDFNVSCTKTITSHVVPGTRYYQNYRAKAVVGGSLCLSIKRTES